MGNAATGTLKYVRLSNGDVAPVQLRTERGSVIIEQPQGLFAAVFDNGQWNSYTNQPWFVDAQEGDKLVASNVVGSASQGFSVALSADGNTLAEGGKDDDSGRGAVFIFTRSGNVWQQQGNKLSGSNGAIGAGQGYSVTLSGDGNTLAEGGLNDDSGRGAVWIFTRSGTSWSQQGTKLTGFDALGTAQQGTSVALSADGNTLAEGGNIDDSNQGAVWIFTRSGTQWAQQGGKLTGLDGGASNQGSSVAISADGNTLAEGGWSNDANQGAVWIFTRSGTQWAQQGAKLTGSNGSLSQQGWSVALSADGNILAEGGIADGANGAVWIFARSTESIWAQQGSKLTGSGALGNALQGYSVALSSDGTTLAEGGRTDDGGNGAVWIFTADINGNWSQRGSKLTGLNGGATGAQGVSVALSANGNTLAEGGPGDAGSNGAVWIFV